MDYALGSVLECAACLDVAMVKQIVGTAEVRDLKIRLRGILGKVIGLRKSWSKATTEVTEESGEYATNQGTDRPDCIFHHERLDVYQVALKIVEWLVDSIDPRALSRKAYRSLDGPVTSVVLNIAEGNGRFSELDHRRFLRIANASAVRMATRIDIWAVKGALAERSANKGKPLLRRVADMTAVMAGLRWSEER